MRFSKYNDIRLIGLTGKAGCGKDTLADLVVGDSESKIAFADALKSFCVEYLGLSHDDAYTQEGKMRYNEFWGMTNREILQRVGTEAMRNGFDKDVWVKIAMIKIEKALNEGKIVVVSDCRFDNEAELIEGLGGIVMKVERNAFGFGGNSVQLSEKESGHASEGGISDDLISSVVFNNGGVNDLRHEFNGKLSIFQNRHQTVVEKISKLVEENEIDGGFAAGVVLEMKKFLLEKTEYVFSEEGNRNLVRLEWPNGNYNCLARISEKTISFKAFSSSSGIVVFECELPRGKRSSWEKIVVWLGNRPV